MLVRHVLAMTLCLSASLAPTAMAQEEEAPPAKQDSDVKIRSIRVVPPPRPKLEPKVILLDEKFEYDAENPVAGTWLGNVMTPIGIPAAALKISHSEDGSWSVDASITPGNLPHRKCSNVQVDGRKISFDFPLFPPEAGKLKFTGEVSEDGQRMRGSVAVPDVMIDDAIRQEDARREYEKKPKMSDDERALMMKEIRASTFELGRTPLAMDLPEPLAYCGSINIFEDVSFKINIVLAETPGGNWVGHIDVPEQYVAGWPLDHVEREGDTFRITMGGSVSSRFEATLEDNGKTLAGKFEQQGETIPFSLPLNPDYTVPDIQMPDFAAAPRPPSPVKNRPQYPGSPLPYDTKEVTISTGEGEILAGTLSIPRSDDPVPAVVMVSGMGGHDRDYTIYGHKFYLVLSDYLTRAGFAVLRYDDRGMGQSSGRFQTATTRDFGNDALAAYSFLRANDRIDPEKIGFLGHDEGALAAALAAQQAPDAAFLVMLAPVGVNGVDYQVSHTAHAMEDVEVDQSFKDAVVDAERALLQAFVEKASEEKLNELALAYADAQRAFAEASEARASSRQGIARMRLARLRQPWNTNFLPIDAAAEYAKLDCPMFAVFGTLDSMTIAEPNRNAIEKTVGSAGGELTVKTYEGHNHLFQPVKSASTAEYGRTETTMDEEVINDITDWLKSWTD